MALTSLYVRDFAIVRQLELELDPGLTVLTGETGAGKSILVDALALGLGARADGGTIRHGGDSAEVLASFRTQPGSDAAGWLAAQELADGDTCITRRIIYRDKPTRAFINGRPATVQMLRELGVRLVDIHGQHEHQSLMRRETQRRVLDAYAGIEDRVVRLSELYEQHRSLSERHDSLSVEAGARTAREDLLKYQIQELETLDMAEDEYAELEVEHRRLAHATELIEGLQYAVRTLHDAEDNAVGDLLARCIQRLESLAEYAPQIGSISALLEEAAVRVDEGSLQLNQTLNRVEMDPQRLSWVEQRIQSILDLARKHRCDPAALPQCLKALRAELSETEDADASLDSIQSQLQDIGKEYRARAGEVSGLRADASQRLSALVTENMQELGMGGGRFDVLVARSEGEMTRYGHDRIEYLVSANAGQPLRPLGKVASGGELSRISLALQVVIAAVGRVPTLVFDEVDVGIGGGVAEIVGQKLAVLGRSRQVLCITHLAQVASQGTSHLQIGKTQEDGVSVEINALTGRSREQEIARMLGGIEITDKTRAHARDMLARASGDVRK